MVGMIFLLLVCYMRMSRLAWLRAIAMDLAVTNEMLSVA
jgi:hypothetical protein